MRKCAAGDRQRRTVRRRQHGGGGFGLHAVPAARGTGVSWRLVEAAAAQAAQHNRLTHALALSLTTLGHGVHGERGRPRDGEARPPSCWSMAGDGRNVNLVNLVSQREASWRTLSYILRSMRLSRSG